MRAIELSNTDRCPVCGHDPATHRRCRACTICVGPGHLEQHVDADGLCADCAELRRRRGEVPAVRTSKDRYREVGA